MDDLINHTDKLHSSIIRFPSSIFYISTYNQFNAAQFIKLCMFIAW